MSFIEKFRDATIGFSGYPRLMRDRRGGFGYLAILLAIVLAINGIIGMAKMRRFLADAATTLETMPDFRIESGRFSFDGPMPYTVRGTGPIRVVIDTTGKTTPADLQDRISILITGDRYTMIQPGLTPREFHFGQLRSSMTRTDLLHFVQSSPERALPFFYLMLYAAQLGFKALDASVLALIALWYSRSARRPISFATGFRLGLYAMSLSVVVQWIWPNFSVILPQGFAIWWGLALIYLVMGLRAIWREEAGRVV